VELKTLRRKYRKKAVRSKADADLPKGPPPKPPALTRMAQERPVRPPARPGDSIGISVPYRGQKPTPEKLPMPHTDDPRTNQLPPRPVARPNLTRQDIRDYVQGLERQRGPLDVAVEAARKPPRPARKSLRAKYRRVV